MLSRVLRAFSWLTQWRSARPPSFEEAPARPGLSLPEEMLQALLDRERVGMRNPSSSRIPVDLLELAASYCFQTRYVPAHGPLKLAGFLGAASTGKSTWFNQLLGQGPLATEDPEPHATQGTIVYLHEDHARVLADRTRASLDGGFGLFVNATAVRQEDSIHDVKGVPGQITLITHRNPAWKVTALVDMSDTSTTEALDSDATALFLPWLDLALLIDLPDTVQRESTQEWTARARRLGAGTLGLLNVWEPGKRLTRDDAERVYRQAGCPSAEILPRILEGGEQAKAVERIKARMRGLFPESRAQPLDECLRQRAGQFAQELRERERRGQVWERERDAALQGARSHGLYGQPLKPEWLLSGEERRLVERHGLARYRPSLLFTEGLRWTARTSLGRMVLSGTSWVDEEDTATFDPVKSQTLLWMEQAEVGLRRALERALGYTPEGPIIVNPAVKAPQPLPGLSSLPSPCREEAIGALEAVLETSRTRLLSLVDEVRERDRKGSWDRTLVFCMVSFALAVDFIMPGLGQSSVAFLPELLGLVSDPLKALRVEIVGNLRRPLDSFLVVLERHYEEQMAARLGRDQELLRALEKGLSLEVSP